MYRKFRMCYQSEFSLWAEMAAPLIAGTSSRQLTVYSGSSQKCLDAFNNQTTPGTKVEIWSCTANPTSNGPSGKKGRFNDDLPLTT